MTNQTIDTNVRHHIPWWVWFIIAVVIGFIGGYLMADSVHYDYFGTKRNWDEYYAGLLVFLCSVPFDILGIKALITEAHVKALEVFHGRKRAVQLVNNNKETFNND